MNEEPRKKLKTRRQRGNCSRGRRMTIPLSPMYKVKERNRERERKKPPQSEKNVKKDVERQNKW